MNKPKIIITGSEGTIGTVLCPSLANQYQIVRTDKTDTSGQNFHRADVSDFDSIKTVFGENAGTEYVIHLAASSLVDTGWEKTLRNNIIGTRNVYECARLFGIKRVIYASSNHVTGGYEGIPPELHTKNSGVQISINDPVRPDSDYGSSKVYGEAVARQYYELHGIRSICLRIGSVTLMMIPCKTHPNACSKRGSAIAIWCSSSGEALKPTEGSESITEFLTTKAGSGTLKMPGMSSVTNRQMMHQAMSEPAT